MNLLLAAISQLPGADLQKTPDPLVGLRENAPLVDIPWPSWAWWALGGGAIIFIAALVWLGQWLGQRNRSTPAPSPRMLALRALAGLGTQAEQTVPHAFSVAVSDVLRTYVSRQYDLRATEQTSPEFLASISSSSRFSDGDRELLATFLDRCDLLKFARIEAHTEENSALLREATAFVQGAQL